MRTGKENLFRFDQFRMLVGEEIRKVLRPGTEISSLIDQVPDTKMPEDVNCIYEIVVNGVNEVAINVGMKAGIEVAVKGSRH